MRLVPHDAQRPNPKIAAARRGRLDLSELPQRQLESLARHTQCARRDGIAQVRPRLFNGKYTPPRERARVTKSRSPRHLRRLP